MYKNENSTQKVTNLHKYRKEVWLTHLYFHCGMYIIKLGNKNKDEKLLNTQ